MKMFLCMTAAMLILGSQLQAQQGGDGQSPDKKPESKPAPGQSGPLSGSPRSNRNLPNPSNTRGPVLDRGSWVKVTDKAPFSPRDTAEDLVYDGKMWISNGYYHGGKLTRDLWSSKDGVNWTLVNPNTPYDGYSEMVVYDNKMGHGDDSYAGTDIGGGSIVIHK